PFVGQGTVAGTHADGTHQSLFILYTLLVSFLSRASHLVGKLPADDREAVRVRAALRTLGGLFAGGGSDYRSAGRETRAFAQRAANPAHARFFVRGDRCFDPGVFGIWIRQGNRRWPLSRDAR